MSADTLTTAAWLFASTYVLVFALGLQSLNVNGGHYRAAFMTSLGIGASNLVLFKMAPDASGLVLFKMAPDASGLVLFKMAPDASGLEIVAYLAGGPLGIVSAMRAHPYIVRLYRRRRTS